MLESLITSKTRIKLLLKFFINSKTSSYLRNLEQEFGENSNAIRLELNRLEEAGLLASQPEGNKKMYHANTKHPLFFDIQNIVYKHAGIDQILENIVNNIGNLEHVYLVGDFAKGKNSAIVDLVFVGSNIDSPYLRQLCDKVEKLINRKIRDLIIENDEMDDYLGQMKHKLEIWHN